MGKFFENIAVVVVNIVGGALAVLLAIAWIASGFVGTIYWIVEDDALNAVLSVFIPMYGAISVILDLAR